MSKELVIQLAKLLNSRPVSIEVLPASWTSSESNEHSPFEFTEGHLGIPKPIYFKTYLAAVSYLDEIPTSNPTELQDVSLVVLLVNPAHINCLNKRKQMIELGTLSPDLELQLIEAILLQPEGAKSSILWHHRRWILRRLFPSESNDVDSLESHPIPAAFISNELAVATSACEIYPRNYHAWLHRYKCLRLLVAIYKAGGKEKEKIALVLRAKEYLIRRWVELNVGDYSAMLHLCEVYAALREVGVDHIPMEEVQEGGTDGQKVYFSLIDHAFDMVERYSNHEALWYYLRTAYSTMKGEANLDDKMDRLAALEKMAISSKHARRFKEWLARFDAVPTLT